jgi:hypothetical protein
MRKSITYLILAAVLTTAFVNCARVAGITGGLKDTLPPVLTRIEPADGTVRFDGKSILVEFDEYVQLKDLQKEFYTSPEMKKTPLVTIRKRGFRIDIIDDSLKADQTYALDFAGAVADNNEGNVLNGFRYVFSTGDHIDSMVMSGYAEDAQKGDSVSKAFVYFFDPVLDSMPEYDSVIFNNKPEWIARAENNGIFIAKNLKPKDYRVYMVDDKNNNKMYDAGVDRVGFLEETYNPAAMRDFSAWYDTTRHYVVAEPQLYFRMFMDTRPARQTLREYSRPVQHRMMLVFAAPWPQIDSLTFDSIPAENIITEYLKPTRDSIALWLNMPSQQLPDTIKGKITYQRPDSMGVVGPHTQELKFAWKKSESNAERREREKREKDIEEGKEVEPLPNPFKITLPSGMINPEKGVQMEFEYPLADVDQQGLRFSLGDSTNMSHRPVKLVQDTAKLRTWHLDVDWSGSEVFRLFIPTGALRNVAEQSNDSITRVFEAPKEGSTASIVVEVIGKTPESEYVLQLTNEGGNSVIDERRHVKTGQVRFNYISPGELRLKVLEDTDGSGEWNTGNLVERRQPERVEFYVEGEDKPTFTARAGWVDTKKVDMNVLFAPITIESVWEKLQREEAVRLEKLKEELARMREERLKREREGTGGTSAMGMMQSATGLSLPGF